MLPDEQTSPEQFECYRRMTPAERLDEASRLRTAARALKRAGLASLHPDWSEERIQQELNHAFLFARS